MYSQSDAIGLADRISTYGYAGGSLLLYGLYGLSYWGCVLNKFKRGYTLGVE